MAAKKGSKKKKGAKKAAKQSAKKAAKKSKKKAKARALPVVHWEIRAREPAKVQEFYRGLFDWVINADNPMKYGMVKSSAGKRTIDGGIGGTENDRLVTFYVQVDDIDAYLRRAEKLGGQTLMPRSDIGPVIMATFRDIEGNEIGLIEG